MGASRRTLVLTGASRGIGHATVKRFAAEGWRVLTCSREDVPARDVCNILDVSETNLRVLLHRGRARVRRALDRYVREGEAPPSRRGVGSVAARSVLGEGS